LKRIEIAVQIKKVAALGRPGLRHEESNRMRYINRAVSDIFTD